MGIVYKLTCETGNVYYGSTKHNIEYRKGKQDKMTNKKMSDKELREKTKHRTFTSMAARRRWLALHEQIEQNKKRTDWLNGKEEKQ